MNTFTFVDFRKKLSTDLAALTSDCKRKYPDVKNAAAKSVKILDQCSRFEDLKKNNDLVDPFILACATENVKLVSTAMLSYQRLAMEQCVTSVSKIDQILDSFLICTNLAVEIQLKVLQILPVFFKTYSAFIVGSSLKKMLCCFTNLLQPNKSSVVIGSSSATLQQLINGIFERPSLLQNDIEDGKESSDVQVFHTLIDNENKTIALNKYQYDTNVVFRDICMEQVPDSLLDFKYLTIDIVLEILESIFLNQKTVIIQRKDLQFILKTVAVPFLLKEISAPTTKSYAITVRSLRATKLLMDRDYIEILDLELEVVLSFLIHILQGDAATPPWKKTLVIEFFCNVEFLTWFWIFKYFDARKTEKQQVLLQLLVAFKEELLSEKFQPYLREAPILVNGEPPLLSQDSITMKTPLLELVDKVHPPVIDPKYGLILLFQIVTNLSSESESYTLKTAQNKEELDILKLMIAHIYDVLSESLRLFFYSSALDTNLFHRLVRGFQKLAHSCCLLKLKKQFDQSIQDFAKYIVQLTAESPKDYLEGEYQPDTQSLSSANTEISILGAISDSFLGNSSNNASNNDDNTSSVRFYPRSFHSRNLDLLKACVALFISSSTALDVSNWNVFFKIWQWCNYYLVGPSQLFSDMFLNKAVPENPFGLSKPSLLSLENSFARLFESTSRYSESDLFSITDSLISLSREALKDEKFGGSFSPFNSNGQLLIATYNRDFFIKILESVMSMNGNRIFRTFKDETWNRVFDYFIEESTTRKENLNQDARLDFVQSFNAIIYGLISSAGSDPAQFALVENHVMTLLMRLINSMLSLKTDSSKDLYNGNVNIESDILLQTLKTVKDLVDNYGDYLKNSWTPIFQILGSPFSLISDSSYKDADSEEERLAIQEALKTKHKSMIQVSFSVFKLISDDFLQSLPLVEIKGVIQTLVQYVSQDTDLNVSFSSISYFWVVGDYLRSSESSANSNETFGALLDGEHYNSLIQKHKSLLSLLSSENLTKSETYTTLWLFLLQSLINCSQDKRLEVKNGAIKTFFQIIDSHSSFLPSWNLVFEEILVPFLGSTHANIPPDFADITLKGLLQVYDLYFNNLPPVTLDNTPKWLKLLDFVACCLRSTNYDTIFTGFDNLKKVLESCEKQEFSGDFVDRCYITWKQYEIDYTDFSQSEKKTNYDCIDKMLDCYPSMHKLLLKNDMLTVEKIVSTFQVFNQSVKYPLLPPFASDKQFLSNLQKSLMNALSCFANVQDSAVSIMYLNQLAVISALQFGTKDTIQKKLGSKLPNNAKSRIPTFEAVGYEAAKTLNENILQLTKIEESLLSSNKYLTSTLVILSEQIISKNWLDFTKEKTAPLWVMASKTFHKLCVLIFSSESTSAKKTFVESLVPLIIDVMSALLTKTTAENPKNELYTREEYSSYKVLFMDNMCFFDNDSFEKLMSSIWSRSFFYEMDEVENNILSSSKNLENFIEKLVIFDFENTLGSIEEPEVIPSFELSKLALEDLIFFSSNKTLKNTCRSFLISRVLIVLRKYISDQKLRFKKPVSTVNKLEILWVLEGLFKVCSSFKSTSDFDGLGVLYPFVLRTIPASNQFEDLQLILQKLSLIFAEQNF